MIHIVNQDRNVTLKLIRRAEAGGIKALFVTVDAPLLGRREKDMRNKFTLQGSDVQKDADTQGKVKRDEGTTRAISQFIDPSLSWKDLAWIQSVTRLPIFLKGVQCGADAVLAAQHGVRGIVCSNHGGRQLDCARSGIEVLEEVMTSLRAMNLQDKLDVYMDGGIRRGSDIIKAVAMGAKAVGVGRPVLYGLAGYGQPGVERVLQILKDEMAMGMRLIGAASLADVKRDMVDTSSLPQHTVLVPTDHLAIRAYEPLKVTSDH